MFGSTWHRHGSLHPGRIPPGTRIGSQPVSEDADQHGHCHDDEDLLSVLYHLAIQNEQHVQNRGNAPGSEPAEVQQRLAAQMHARETEDHTAKPCHGKAQDGIQNDWGVVTALGWTF